MTDRVCDKGNESSSNSITSKSIMSPELLVGLAQATSAAILLFATAYRTTAARVAGVQRSVPPNALPGQWQRARFSAPKVAICVTPAHRLPTRACLFLCEESQPRRDQHRLAPISDVGVQVVQLQPGDLRVRKSVCLRLIRLENRYLYAGTGGGGRSLPRSQIPNYERCHQQRLTIWVVALTSRVGECKCGGTRAWETLIESHLSQPSPVGCRRQAIEGRKLFCAVDHAAATAAGFSAQRQIAMRQLTRSPVLYLQSCPPRRTIEPLKDEHSIHGRRRDRRA